MIALDQVWKSFGPHPVLRGLSLEVPAGRILGLLGPNGAGKTTTLNLIMGFLPADAGTVSVDGIDPARAPARVRDLVAYLPESVSLYPELTGTENLAYLAALGGRRLAANELYRLLNRTGLAEEAHDRRVGTYSKGMRQRVALAVALAKRARVLLLDEPTTGLDPAAVQELARLLRSLAGEGTAVLLTTHDLWHLSIDCDEVGILREGVLVDRFAAAALSAQQLAERYLAPRDAARG
jgi:ABC-2 type transport system ATP-binding protein